MVARWSWLKTSKGDRTGSKNFAPSVNSRLTCPWRICSKPTPNKLITEIPPKCFVASNSISLRWKPPESFFFLAWMILSLLMYCPVLAGKTVRNCTNKWDRIRATYIFPSVNWRLIGLWTIASSRYALKNSSFCSGRFRLGWLRLGTYWWMAAGCIHLGSDSSSF